MFILSEKKNRNHKLLLLLMVLPIMKHSNGDRLAVKRDYSLASFIILL